MHGLHVDQQYISDGDTASRRSQNKLIAIIYSQSNGYGKGVAANMTLLSNPTVPYANVLLYDHNALLQDPPTFVDETWRALQPRAIADGASYPIGTCGVELSMGRVLDTGGIGTIYVAKMTIDGSGLQDHWLSNSWPTIGTKLPQLASNFIAARLAEKNAVLAAIVMAQGENDAGSSPQNTNYLTNLGTLDTSLRAQFGSTYAFVIHRLSNRNQGRNSATIRAAEESFVSNHPGSYIVPVDDIALRDAAHYVDDGYVTVGNRDGSTIIGHVQATPPAANPVWTAAAVPVIMAANQLLPIWPVNHKAGDIALLVLSGIGQNAYTLATPAGFVQVTNSPQHNAASGLNSRIHVWWARADQATMNANGGAMPNPVVTEPAGADQALAAICTFRGCTASGNPWDVTVGGTAFTSAAPGTAVSITGNTTTVPNTLVVSICSSKIVANIAEIDGWANPDLTNLTEQFDVSNNTGAGSSLGIATGVKAAAGAYQATTATLAVAASQTFMSIALKP